MFHHLNIVYASNNNNICIRIDDADDDDARMTMKRHDQIYNLLTMTMGLPLGWKKEEEEEKSNGRELLRRISGEQKRSR